MFRRLPPSIRRRVVHAGTPNFTVGALLLLRDDTDRILLLRQRHTSGWSLPGGLLDQDETPAAAVVRELGEELGLRLRPDEVTPAVPHALVNPQSRRVDIVFTAVSNASTKPDGVEILEARWFAPDDLPQCGPGTHRVLTHCGVIAASR